ncbi:MAG TPA: hypothetical protein PKC28_05040 [Bdellovibrionales bacterium]|nr:hypothetical protein [Bdellovibrionales bacterium]
MSASTLLTLTLTFAPLTHATATPNPCDAYPAKSAQLACANDGYLVSFGDKYCRLFHASTADFTPAGQQTLKRIRECLIEHLKDPQLTCANVKERSQSAHVECYLKGGYCELSKADKWTIFKKTWRNWFGEGFHRVRTQIQEGCRHR